MADTTTERSRWLVLIQLAITNQKRASVERGCSKVLTFSQRSETAPWIRQDPKPLRTPAGTAGSCWFHESDYCRAARYTTSIFLFVLLANSDLADTVGVAHPSVNSNRPPLSALLASTLAVFRTRAALQHCAMLLAVFDLPPIVLVPPAPISRPSNPEGRNK